MKNAGKRILAMLLCIVMCLSLLPLPALAEEGTIEASQEGTITVAGQEAEDASWEDTIIDSEKQSAEESVSQATKKEIGENEDNISLRSEDEPEKEIEERNIVASGACGVNLTWELDDEGTLTISGTGEMRNYLYDTSPWISHRTAIKAVIMESGVTSIGDYAFFNCWSLLWITIPEGVISIGEASFFECKKMTSISLPESLTMIGESAFCACDSLISVTIPENVSSIGFQAFYSDDSLESILVQEGNEYYCSEDGVLFDKNMTTVIKCPDGKSGMYEIPEGVTSFAADAFWGCKNLTNVTIPSSIKTIPDSAFSMCSGLKSITIPESVTSIGCGAFENCESLTNIIIPKSITIIAVGTFENCYNLVSITIPENITSIEKAAFYRCSNLMEISFEGSAPNIGNDAFYGVVATAYYPAKELSWTEDVCQNYGGTITWVAVANVVDSGTCGDNLTWTLNDEETLTISGSGTMYNYGNVSNLAPWTDYKTEIQEIIIEEGVTSIGSEAFYSFTSLARIYFPSSLATIHNGAFYHSSYAFDIYVTSLEMWCNLSFPNRDTIDDLGRYALYCNNELITKFVVPESVTEINDFAFSSGSFESIVLHDGITKIGWCAFYGCENLISIVVPDSVDEIGESAFGNCTNLLRITMPNGLTHISDRLFYNCTSLTKISIPETVVSIGNEAFSCCSCLTFISIPSNVSNIGTYAFSNCSSLGSIEIPEMITEISEGTFQHCSDLQTVTNCKNVIKIGNNAFYNCISLNRFDCTEIVNEIGKNAFYNCYNLREIILPDSVKTIGEYAFYNCRNLLNLNIPNGIKRIENYTFCGCSKLTTIVVPNSVIFIGAYALPSSLKHIIFLEDMPAMAGSAFGGATATVYYPNNNDTWIEEDYIYYGNTITWQAYNSICEITGHTYLAPIWTWSADFSSAVAVFTCSDCGDTRTVNAEVTRTANGAAVTYTAMVTFNGETYTDEKIMEVTPSNITSTSVDFNGKMHLITYIKLSDEVMADEDATVSVTFNDVTTNHSVAELIRNLDSQGRVKVRQEMYAAMMRDEMTLQVFDGDGVAQPLTYKGTTDVTDGFVFTALEYLKGRQAESTNPYMVELAKAAELYGIAVQVKFDYHTEQLTAEDIAKMEAAAGDITIPASCDEEVTGTLPAGVTKQTKTVMFESDNTLRLYYYFDDASFGNYTFTLDGETVTAAKKEAGKYYVQQENIASGLLSSRYAFTVSDGTDTYTVNTSALAYAYGRQENSSDQQMIDLSKLLYRYSLAADAYFG